METEEMRKARLAIERGGLENVHVFADTIKKFWMGAVPSEFYKYFEFPVEEKIPTVTGRISKIKA